MTITPQSSVILCNCPLKNDYKHQITWENINAQSDYFNKLENKKQFNDFTYIKNDDVIYVDGNIDDLRIYNYLYYTNTGFTNKRYYCFITKMEYASENSTKIYFETDVFQTWYFDINYKQSFIEREHVNNDSTGLHTIPENLELGEYICNSHYKDSTMDNYVNDLCYVMASTSLPITGEAKDTVANSQIYNGIYTGLMYFRYDKESPIDIILEIFANSGKTEAINGIFMAPKWLAPLKEDSTYRNIKESNNPSSFNINVSKQSSLNGYSPKNNKLKCFPYNYLLVSNNIGQNAILHYEKFSGNNATFNVKGVLNPGCSINLTPTNYNGSESSDNDAIQLGKFPICNFQNDMYTNWLTQNSINVLGNNITTDDMNIAGNILSSASSLITNLAVQNYAGAGMSLASGFSGITNSLIQQKQHNMIPPTVNGQLNSGDVNVASGNNTFHFYKMSIKKEYAEIIDKYFDYYGYKVNEFKKISFNSRKNWNFIKTIECNIDGKIPQDDIEKIKNIFNDGVTMWHNPSTFLDYSQTNNIV